MPTIEQEHKNQNKKGILYLIIFGIVLFACIAATVWNVVFRTTENNVLPYSNLTLQDFYSYRYGSDFTYVTDAVKVDAVKENYFYKAESPAIDKNNLKNGALKLGLSNEAYNPGKKLTVWTKPGIDDLSGDYIQFDETVNTLDLLVDGGLNSKELEVEEVYPYLVQFFGLNENEVTISENTKFGDTVFLTYQAKLFDKHVYFNGGNQTFATVAVTKGKIIQVFIRILPKNFSNAGELKSITEISKETIPSFYYQISVKPQINVGSSNSGTEIGFNPPASFGYRQHENSYMLYTDPVLGNVLLPVVAVSGVYTDKSDDRGEATLLIVNQEAFVGGD